MRGSWFGSGWVRIGVSGKRLRGGLSAIGLCLCLCWTVSAWAEAGVLDPADLQNLLRTREAVSTYEAPRMIRTDGGFLTFIGAPPGDRFATPASLAKTVVSPEAVALDFIGTHGAVFGVQSANTAFTPAKVHTRNGRSYVHLSQSYGGLKVFGGQIMVQVDGMGGVEAVLSDIMRNTERLDSGDVALVPTVTADGAIAAAFAEVAAFSPYSVADLDSTVPELLVYRPTVLGGSGATRLVWSLIVTARAARIPSVGGEMPLEERVLVDAHSGDVILHFTLIHTGMDRNIYDAQNTWVIRGNLARAEGDLPVDEPQEVNDAYDFLGDTYLFYANWLERGRDGIDDKGSPMHCTVRFGADFLNAFWTGTDMVFGEGFLVDDVTGHELTHGVTGSEDASELIYYGESGAISESFSDIFGEFIDLTNGRDDVPGMRWYLGEDSIVGAMRYMADPPVFRWFPSDRSRWYDTPDRYRHPDFYRGEDDNAGVHFNSGVGNKLCYLLTDGGTFNGYTVQGMGIPESPAEKFLVADLFYETQFILLPASGYLDLFAALEQAAFNIGMGFEERTNVLLACRAVEIVPVDHEAELKNFRALSAFDSQGTPVSVLRWRRPTESGLHVKVLRRTGAFPMSETDGVRADASVAGVSNALVDGADGSLFPGEDYFYGAFWTMQGGLAGIMHSRATAGAGPRDLLSEEFSQTVDHPIDLSFSQLLFSPAFDPAAAEASGFPGDYVNHDDYAVTIVRGVYELPVPRADENGGAFSLTMSDDGVVDITLGQALLPFFGQVYDRIGVAANGYVAFGDACEDCDDNQPSLGAHAQNVRVSPLFADLGLSMGGSVWARFLDDRAVITYENVPERPDVDGRPQPVFVANTVQLELFYSGHIRMTYLDLNVDHAIVGISDGRGPATAPTLKLGTTPVGVASDLSASTPGNPDRLTLWPPVPVQFAAEGESVRFSVNTNSPAGTPRLTAEWDRGGSPPFADNGDGTGEFIWQTSTDSAGTTTVTVVASLGRETAFQAIPIVVANVALLPGARLLKIGTGTEGEDPMASREADVDLSLTGDYSFSHPLLGRPGQQSPVEALEGSTSIRWYRNAGAVLALFDTLRVPARVTRAGDRWFFTVTPRTVLGVTGEMVSSPVITITANPIVANVSPNTSSVLGGTRVRITGRHLSSPLSVTFGGAQGVDLVSLGDEELEVTSPVSRAGTVDLVVTTESGSIVVEDGFVYLITDEVKARADVNRDGVVDAVDVQLVIEELLRQSKTETPADTNGDGQVNSADLQIVVNAILAG